MNLVPLASLAAVSLLVLTAPSNAQSPADGERLFRSRCMSCHAIAAGQNRVGPSLAGVFGRAAGSVEGARYSPALRASGITWDEQSLDSYLANPRGIVPGTTMTIALPDAGQRSAIIGYLRTQSQP